MATARSLTSCVAFVVAVNVCVFCLIPLTGLHESDSSESPHLLRDRKLDLSCEAIRLRALNRRNFRKLAFGVAHVRIVYQNYQFLEDEFISSYHPQNVFCYSVDAKAANDFNDDIKSLSKCFPNVVYTKGFNAIDHIHTITKLIEVSREYGLPLCLTFDLKKAFDAAAWATPSKLRWGGHVMRFADTSWTRAVTV
ncbi:unnamed protein product [Heligmosomoides polygyrus]|uniref:Reverse transcriptase domain-containing protein n=1 Tax=Heligmosomoides polygyrus TaxID=6339 RepID=A0A183F5K8_HELPZ|nr:unnamed protein product [Heligmosomoides polygyrus]